MRAIFFVLLFPYAALCQTVETVIQQGHELAVVALAVRPDSSYVATGSKDKSAKLWETSTGREIRSFSGHGATVTSMAFSPDGKTLVTGSNDKSIRYWDIATGRESKLFESDNIVTSIAIDPRQKFLVAGGYGNSGYGDSLIVYDFASGTALKKIRTIPDKGLGSGVHVDVSPDGKLLAVGEDNRTVNLYETKDWNHIRTLSYEEGQCGGCGTRVRFSPDNKKLFVVSHHGPARSYALDSYAVSKTFHSNVEDVTGIDVSHNGKWLAVSTEKGVVIFDAISGDTVAMKAAEESKDFNEIRFRGNERLIITSNDNTAFEWSFLTGKIDLTYTGYLNERDRGGMNYDPNFYWQSAIAKYIRLKNPLLLTPDGKMLIKGKFGTKVKLWDAATGQTTRELTGHKKAVLCYDLSKDGEKLVTGGGDGKIMLWDLISGDSTAVIHAYREPIFDIQFNEDETQVVSSSWDATMKVHDLKTGKTVTRFDWQSVSAYNVLFHKGGLYVVSARLDHSLQMWELDTRKEIRNFIGHTDVISSLQSSKDDNQFLTASWDGTIRLWNIATGLMSRKIVGHKGAVHAAIYSADEKHVYSGGADRIIRVWDVHTGKEVRRFEGHKAEVSSLALNHARNMLVSYSLDGVTKFWDLATGKEFFEHIHLGENDWMAKSPDGYFNATDNARRHIHFVSGMNTYSVDQFFNEFFRPDLLPKFFNTRSAESKSIQKTLRNSPPPELKLAVIPVAEGKADLYVRITDGGGGVRDLRLYHNGKSIPLNANALVLPKTAGENTTFKQEVNLVAGSNIFSATARNTDNIESDIQTAELFSDHIAKNSTCHILAVGINQYRNSKLNLNFARADAEAFSNLLQSGGGSLFKSVQVHTLYDHEATREKILKKLDDLSLDVGQEDVLILYYAGHGSMVDNNFYFVPSEGSRLYDASALRRDGIEARLLQEKLKHIKALKQLIVMDACQSGGSVELLATRGGSTEKAIAQLSRSAGIHVIAAASSEQFATEFASLGHGLFTHVLLKALQGEADGAPRDGKVTIYELKSYIDDQVPEMTRKLKGNPQYPYTFSRGHDFPVVANSEAQ